MDGSNYMGSNINKLILSFRQTFTKNNDSAIYLAIAFAEQIG
jgi:hypothetical protein